LGPPTGQPAGDRRLIVAQQGTSIATAIILPFPRLDSGQSLFLTWGFIDRVVAHSDDHVRARGREVALRDEFGRLDALILNASGGLERGAYPASGATSG
jgi:hypothetical protein